MPYYGHLSQREYIARWQDFKDYFQDDEAETLRRPMRDALRRFLGDVLRQDLVAQLYARRYERTPERKGYRNGSYFRSLVTAFGLIPRLEVPRPRNGGIRTQVFRRYRRCWRAVEDFIRYTFLAGASTRETGLIVEQLLGKRLSASAVSSLVKLLAGEVRKYHARQLANNWRLLILDGVWVKVGGYKLHNKVMLVVYGVRADGRREVIDFRLARSESRDEWAAFLWDLYRRGLTGVGLWLVTVDGGKGLIAAAREVWPQVPLQRCWVHKLRNLASKLPAKYRETCLAEAKRVYLAQSYRAAIQRCRRWADKWRKLVPKVVECLEADIEDLLVHMRRLQGRRKLWVKVRTTNVIERLFRELRKRIRPMCGFADGDSCDRIVYMLFMKYNQQWQDRPLWTKPESTQND
ncbi:IS256 family transposase [candidate division WOR-3 bacterium]|nr:IS256 family transposase [candidate division WOR-3 bacterium]